jgi:hypothetical protein
MRMTKEERVTYRKIRRAWKIISKSIDCHQIQSIHLERSFPPGIPDSGMAPPYNATETFSIVFHLKKVT